MFLSKQIFAGRGPLDDFWYNPVGSYTNGGRVINDDTASRLSVVFACVQILSETVAQVPLPLYRRLSNGGKERATDHPLYELIMHAPNPQQTAFEWREQVQAYLGLRGNAVCPKVTNGRGDVIAIQAPLCPDRLEYREIDEGLLYVYSDDDGNTVRYLPDEVLHIKYRSKEGKGLSPIHAHRESIGLGLATQEHATSFYKNGAQIPGVISLPGKFKDKEQREEFRESWQAAQTGRNQFKTPVLEYGMTYQPVGLSQSDAQFIETRKYQDIDIARVYRIPPHMLGILDRATFSNIEQQSLDYVVYTMTPWFVRWEQALSNALLLPDERPEYFFEFVVDGLLRGDITNRYAAYQTGIQNGFLTRNEVRKKENMDPLEGLDEPLEPMNMRQPGAQDKTQALALASAERVANKELIALKKIRAKAETDDEFREQAADFFVGHIDFVQKQMACSHALATDYCRESANALMRGDIDSTLSDWEDNKAQALAAQRMKE